MEKKVREHALAFMIVRLILAGIFSLFTLLFAGTALTGIVNTGSIAGTVISGICAFCLWRFDFVCRMIQRAFRHTGGKILVIVLGALVVIGVAAAGFFSAIMIKAQCNAPSESEKGSAPVVVLGCKVNGETPSRMLRLRLDAAADYLKENPVRVCVVSGGQGRGETTSEAAVMQRYLIEKGIDASRILCEDQSQNTEQNLAFSRALLEKNGYDAAQIVLITDGYHQCRAALLAEREGIAASAVNAKTELWLLPTYWVREWFALVKFFLFA